MGSGLALALGLVLALAPKCPMCIAAYLSIFGVGMAAAGALAPWCWPIALGLLLGSALCSVSFWARARRPARRPLESRERAAQQEARQEARQEVTPMAAPRT